MNDTGSAKGNKSPPYAVEKLRRFRDSVESGELGECISTGIPALDQFLGGGLMPYLYVLMAFPGAGKTTLVQQMIDAIAQSGRDVISVDLDMSEDLIFAKALSRHSYRLYGPRGAVTMQEVMSLAAHPNGTNMLNELCESYAKTAEHLVMVGREELKGQESLKEIVRSVCKEGKPKPVVCVDFLQCWASMDSEENEKRAVDKALDAVKELSQSLKIPVVLISSVNRASYQKKELTLASAKESGNIEYAADVVLGMETVEGDVGEGCRKVRIKTFKTRFDDKKTFELIMNGAYNVFYSAEERPRSRGRCI